MTTGATLVTRSSSTTPSTMNPPKTSAPAIPPAITPTRPRGVNRGPRELTATPLSSWGCSDFEDLEVFRGPGHGAGVQVVEDEPGVGVSLLERGRRLPAHVAEDVARP